MEFLWIALISIVLIIGMQFLFVMLGQKTMMKLSELLYVRKDVVAYLKRLDRPISKFYFPYQTRLMMRVDAYIMQGNKSGIVELVDQIEKTKVRNIKDRSLYLQKVMTYAIDSKQFEFATRLFKLIELHQQNDGFKDYEETYKECQAYYYIYVENNANYIESLLTIATTKESLVKGLYYFRIAKAYAHLKLDQEAQSFIEQSYELLKNTDWATAVKQAKDNPKRLVD